MNKPVALVTGAGGEMGHALVPALTSRDFDVVTVDLVELSDETRRLAVESVEASVLDSAAMRRLVERHRPEHVYHLAAVLSKKAEREPFLAHQVNVDGTALLLEMCARSAADRGRPVRFFFPSSIAVYGLPDAGAKAAAGPVREDEWCRPRGMYGCNKLYCELLGAYLTRQAKAAARPGIDFRAIRFPGLISADTVPTGGTSDYASEMVHSVARGERYDCFVREDTRLPFMTMPDAVDALLRLVEAPPDDLRSTVYNIRAFSPTAGAIATALARHYPGAEVSYDPDPARQAVVDTWPGDVDDRGAREDWGFSPEHDLGSALADYLLPRLAERDAAGA